MNTEDDSNLQCDAVDPVSRARCTYTTGHERRSAFPHRTAAGRAFTVAPATLNPYQDFLRRLDDGAAFVRRAVRVYEAAVAWCVDTGDCHFCMFDQQARTPHDDTCPLAHLNADPVMGKDAEQAPVQP